MASYNRAPDPINSTFFIPGSNTPGNGVKVFTYSNLSSTKVTVYKDSAGAAQHTNPIILDSGGNLPVGSQVYIAAGNTLTIKYAPSNDTDPPLSPYLTINDVVGINDVSTAVSEWTLGPAPTFVSATVFTIAGDQTANFEKGRFVKSSNTGGTAYSKIINSVFGVLTTVTVVNINGAIDSGLSSVSYGADAVNPAFGADHINRKATAVASAASGTTGIWDTNGDYVHVTGTNPIFNFSTAAYAGASRDVTFDGALSLNTSAALTLPGNLNVTTSANDRIRVRAETVSTASVLIYQSAFNPAALQTSNTVFAGPATGSAMPGFRGLVGAEAVMSLLSVKSATSTPNSIDFTSSDVAFGNYDEIKFQFIGMRPTINAATFRAIVSHDGGVTFNSTASYQISQIGTDAVTTNINVGIPSANAMVISSLFTNQGQSNVSTFAGFGNMSLYASNTTTINKYAMSDYTFENQVSSVVTVRSSHKYTSTTLMTNGVRFFYASGSSAAGVIRVYGMRNS